ncbi:hypothetical protein DdX_00491 [Ditylenchus destructor]|uniref:Uncharacterized protein n=1 Tax=Ditylenchus destructor TaxID=166010 RepID=A0AAD4NK43_9BILA|nr:hypothetical protein DdX_00491 [Ditylenchus destructor]
MPGDDENTEAKNQISSVPTLGAAAESMELTPTSVFNSLVSGQPAHVTMTVVGWCAPDGIGKKRKFVCYLENSDNFAIKLVSWANVADEMSTKLKLYSTVRMRNLDVKPIWLFPGEPNITSSALELVFNSANSEILRVLPISADDLKKIGPYPEPNKYPPFWKRLNEIKPYQRHLCGNAIVLRDFEKYTLTYSEFKQSVSKQGIYGIIGDGQQKKVCFFIKIDPAEEGPALAEFKRGFFFRYSDVRSTVVGTTLWLISDYVWTAPVELDGAKWDLEETSYQFVDIKRPTNTGSVKQEPDENAPTPKRARLSMF